MNDPYVYNNTNILINKLDIKDQKVLDDYETTVVNLGIIRLLKEYPNIKKVDDIFIIHKILFENVYDWAGQARKIDIYKEEPVLNGLSVEYSNHILIKDHLEKVQSNIDNINWIELSKNDLVFEVAKIISAIWQVHAFREGNTRVVTLFLYYFLKNIGFNVNREFIKKHVKYFRNALVLSSIGEYSEFNYLEEILKDSISFKVLDENLEAKYQTINGYNLKKYVHNYHFKKKK